MRAQRIPKPMSGCTLNMVTWCNLVLRVYFSCRLKHDSGPISFIMFHWMCSLCFIALGFTSEKHPKNGFWLHWMGSYGSRVPSEAFSFRVLVWGFRAPYLKNATKKFYTNKTVCHVLHIAKTRQTFPCFVCVLSACFQFLHLETSDFFASVFCPCLFLHPPCYRPRGSSAGKKCIKSIGA